MFKKITHFPLFSNRKIALWNLFGLIHLSLSIKARVPRPTGNGTSPSSKTGCDRIRLRLE
jgi:hypothetical protein